jgi:hypothetical protein
MAAMYQCSIFAYELEKILRAHNSSIAALGRSPFKLESRRVERLRASLRDAQYHPGLHQNDIITIVTYLGLNDTEYHAILAALFALHVQSMLSSWKVEEIKAWEIADEVRLVILELLEQKPELTDDLLRRIPTLPGVSPPPGELRQDTTHKLNQALDDYDTGMRYVTLGQLYNDGEESRLFIEQGYLYLQKAARELAAFPAFADDYAQLAEWRDEIQRSLLELEDEFED